MTLKPLHALFSSTNLPVITYEEKARTWPFLVPLRLEAGLKAEAKQ